MSNQNVLDTITLCYPTLTKSGKRVADYIFSNKTEAQYMSISSLAEEARVADASVTRFCKILGFDGYNEFKLALAKSSTSNTQNVDEMITGDITTEDSISDMSKKLFSLDYSALQQTLDLLNEEDITTAVDCISRAVKVYCFGQGGSGILAKEAWSRFLTVSPKFECIEDNHLQAMAASMCTPLEVILFFSYSGATKDALETLRLAKSRGAVIILITHFPKSPVSAYADILLICGNRESPLDGGSVAAKMGQLFLIDILFHEYCRKNTALTNDYRDAAMNAIANKML